MNRRKRTTGLTNSRRWSIIGGMIMTLLLGFSTPGVAGDPPVACFSVSPAQPVEDRDVTFNASCSYDPDGWSYLRYEWTVIELGETATGRTYTRQFVDPGTYTIKLVVVDNENKRSWTTKSVIISPAPTPTPTPTPSPYTIIVIPSVGGAVIGPTGQDDAINCTGSTDPNSSLCKEMYQGEQAVALKAMMEPGWTLVGWKVNGVLYDLNQNRALVSGARMSTRGIDIPPGQQTTVELVNDQFFLEKSGDLQIARINRDSGSFTLRVINTNGEGQPGVNVDFTITIMPSGTAGTWLAYNFPLTTDSNGEVRNKLFLGDKTGTYTVTATAAYYGQQVGMPQTFTIEGLDILIEEDSTQTYGYDDYTSPLVPYKSIESGQSDPVKLTMRPVLENLSFTSTAETSVTVSPLQPSSDVLTLTLTGIANGEADIQLINPTSSAIDLVYAKTYTKPLPKPEVALIQVIEENDDVQVMQVSEHGTPYQLCVSAGANGKRDTNKNDVADDEIDGENINSGFNGICETEAYATNLPGLLPDPGQMQNYLDKVYNQAVFGWSVSGGFSCAPVNYDVNNDRKLEYGLQNSEIQAIIDNCKKSNYPYNVFFVINSTRESLAGFAGLGYPYAFIMLQAVVPEQTTAHELGHAAFRLEDIFNQDSENLMDYYRGWRLRRWQWDKINP